MLVFVLEPSCEGIGVVVNHETPETDYTLSMTASDSYDSCGPFDMYDLIKMLKGSGKMWRSTCKKTVPHTLVIEPTAECRGDDWTVQYLSFKLKGAKKVEIYVDEEKVFSVSYTATGPIALNRHLTVMKIRADPLCTACGEEEETPYHFLGKYCARMMVRYSIFGAYLMEGETSNSFAVRKNLKEVFITFGYIGDAHLAALDWPRRWEA